MSERQAAITEANDRSRDYRKIVLSVALLLGAAAALIGGAFATFTDTVTAGPQAISSGTIKIAVGPVNDAATGATNVAAGDTIAREADLNSTGATIANKEITLKFTASPTSLLDTDPTNGLQVSIKACTVAAGAPFVGGGYGLLYGRLNLETTAQPIRIARLPRAFEGFRICQLSDIHIGPFMPSSEIRKYVA